MAGFKVDLCGSVAWDQLVKAVVNLSSPKVPFPARSALKPKRASDTQGTWTWGEPPASPAKCWLFPIVSGSS